MEITPELITYLEVLGRIHLTEDEKIRTQKDLASILGYIDQLNRLDTENVELNAQNKCELKVKATEVPVSVSTSKNAYK